MKKRFFAAMIVIISILIFVLAGCSGKTEQSKLDKEEAINMAVMNANFVFSDLRVSRNGETAKNLSGQIAASLASAGLPLGYISLRKDEVEKYIDEAYVREAHDSWTALKKSKDPVKAEAYRHNILMSAKAAGRSLASIGVNATQMNRLVAQAHLREASRQGVKLTDSDYQKAGLTAPADEIQKIINSADKKKKLAKKK